MMTYYFMKNIVHLQRINNVCQYSFSRESVFQFSFSVTVDGVLLSPSVDIIASLSDIAAGIVAAGISGTRGVYTVLIEYVETVRVVNMLEVVMEGGVSMSDMTTLEVVLQEYVRSLDASKALCNVVILNVVIFFVLISIWSCLTIVLTLNLILLDKRKAIFGVT